MGSAGPVELGYVGGEEVCVGGRIAQKLGVGVLVLVLVPVSGACDREYTVEELCAGEGPAELVLGHGSGAEFIPFTDGEDVTITLAPQGGFGVSVRARTLGALANAPVNLVMSSTWDGADAGQFDWGEIPLYCQEDGHGLFFGAVVPLDPAQFPDVEALAALEGERVTLRAQITDARGVEIVGAADVVLHLPETSGGDDTGDTGAR